METAKLFLEREILYEKVGKNSKHKLFFQA